MPSKFSPLDRILGRVEDLDAENLSILVQRLARERSVLETVINNVQEGILLIDSEGLIEFANAAAQELIGLKAAQVGHSSLWKLVPDLARSLNISSTGEFAGMSTVSREFDLTYPEHRHVRLYLVPVEGLADNSSARYVTIFQDITDDTLKTREQIESERINSIFQLAAGVAHELGNPLNSLTIHLQLIERQIKKLGNEAASAKLNNALEICRREVDRLDGIIQNFLEAVRPQQPDLRDVDLITPLEETLLVVGPEMQDSGIALELEMPTRPPIVSADPDQIKQVYFNILKNAREAMERGGSVNIKAYGDDEFVYVSFADTGAGIDPETLAQVFQPYFTTKTQGNGLGMMIVQRIMNAHGGNIGLDSKEGVGTVVTLQFPQKHRRVRMIEE